MLEKKNFKGEKMYFPQTYSKIMIRNFSRYIVTEIKIFLECLVFKGVSFYSTNIKMLGDIQLYEVKYYVTSRPFQ